MLLHDHLDGGVRPATVVELAQEFGYDNLPTTDVEELSTWFNRGAKRNDLVLYLETFAHTVGVMSRPAKRSASTSSGPSISASSSSRMSSSGSASSQARARVATSAAVIQRSVRNSTSGRGPTWLITSAAAIEPR